MNHESKEFVVNLQLRLSSYSEEEKISILQKLEGEIDKLLPNDD